jgi:UDP-N-acetylglucosamine pyrophosphorylase
MITEELRAKITDRMRSAGLHQSAIGAFLASVEKVAAGDTGLCPESDIEAISSVSSVDALPPADSADTSLLKQLAVIKLNGGLGTGMGLDRAKSLIPIKDGHNFLDLIVRQILLLRSQTQSRSPQFYFMNSVHTRDDTLGYLKRYPSLAGGDTIDFLQNAVPKLIPDSLEPAQWPSDPGLEWCPPGHGDIYPSLLGSGLLDEMRARGIRYLFVSNSDNLGATVSLPILSYFATSGLSFLMEVAERTAADRKGGHLARRRQNGRFLLRESAQCPKEDEESFQDISRHRFFNTNNLWIELEDLRSALADNGGVLPLPLIKNAKTVDPRKPDSPKVLQLESAMGAAIELFPRSGAILTPRTRFAPVKTTSDLLVLRSDAYCITDDFRLVLAEERRGQPPLVELDPAEYKLLANFEAHFAEGAPSLVRCDFLKVFGKVSFSKDVVCQGKVVFINESAEVKMVPPGVYADKTCSLS